MKVNTSIFRHLRLDYLHQTVTNLLRLTRRPEQGGGGGGLDGTCAVAAAARDEGHGEAGVDVVHAGELLGGGLGAAALLVGALAVVHHQLLHLDEALDDRRHPEVCRGVLGGAIRNTF